jgi:U4/U6 small nuclear ribonucleoprotein PRP3
MSDNALAGTKRAAEDGGAAPKERKKRSRWGQKPPEQSNPPGAAAAAAAAVAAAAAAVAPPVAAVETPEMVKARQLAELQASIDAQLQAAMGGVSSAASGFSAKPQLMPGLAGGGLQSSFGAAGARAAQSLTSTAAAGPGSITMDAEGNLVDAAGNVISSAGAGQRGQISSLKVNLNAEQRKAFKVEKAYIEKDRARNPYYDPRVVTSKLQRKTRHLKFHGIDLKAGKHVKEAERMRARVAENELAEELKARGVDPMDEAKKAGTLDPSADPNTMALGQRKQERKQVLENVPDLEWWDAPFISSYDDVSDGKFNIVGDKITHLIEHPVQIAPPGEDKAVPSIPLYLTKQVGPTRAATA